MCLSFTLKFFSRRAPKRYGRCRWPICLDCCSALFAFLLFSCALFQARQAVAIDPPHPSDCAVCHKTHSSPGAGLGTVAGNGNLCMSCHQAGGSASAKAFASTDQAVPWPGLPTGTNGAGTSHRWDGALAGRVQFIGGAVTPSTGTLLTSGTYTGAYAKTYTLTITNAGNSGVARFNWSAVTPGGGAGAGTNILTGTNIALNEGVLVTFFNGSGTSFQVNDKWNIMVRTDLRLPISGVLQSRMTNALIQCSTCHNEHTQTNTPFDASAPVYAGTNTGAGRHYMSVANDTEQMCLDCHAARNVTNSVFGSHPIGMALTNFTNSIFYKVSSTNLPMLKASGTVGCLTCHDVHYSASTDGSLTRATNRNALCIECHTLAQTVTNLPAAHLAMTNSLMLWPGGQYGTTFPPITDAVKRGTCVNCHQPHGWPDAANPTNHYAKLLVDFEENLCFTCHDTNGPAVKQVMSDFTKTNNIHHPVQNSDRVSGRSVECTDCHNPHKALADAHTYSSTNKTITAVTNNGSGLIRIAAGLHGFVNNDTVLVTNVGGVNAVNGTWRITVVATNTFDLQGPAFAGTYTSGGTAIIVANTNRNLVGNPLKGVSGVAFRYTSLTNYEVITTNRYTWIAEATGVTNSIGATNEYQICFKCHSGYGFPSYGGGTASFTTNSTTVTGSGTAWSTSLVGMWLAQSNDTAFYVITNVASTTSLGIWPAYRSATAANTNYLIRNFPPGVSSFANTNNGIANFTNNSTTLRGTGTLWHAGLIGTWIRRTNETTNYKIMAVANATNLTISPAYSGATTSAQPFTISLATDVAQEFSPFNKSGHPIITGLDNYSNSVAVGTPAKRGLQAAYLKAPWTNNIGTQTMMCSDCHNTDNVTPAAQGPHGSAAQFMLRGANATNWPNITVSSIATSWCMSTCHNNFTQDPHGGNHSNYRCFACHLIVPHGGKMSRLIGNRNTMPARYAWLNNTNNMQIQSFNKKATASYITSDCQAACTTTHGTATTERW